MFYQWAKRVNRNDIEIYVYIAFYNSGIFQHIFHTSIYFWKPRFVSDMYHSYFVQACLVIVESHIEIEIIFF